MPPEPSEAHPEDTRAAEVRRLSKAAVVGAVLGVLLLLVSRRRT